MIRSHRGSRQAWGAVIFGMALFIGMCGSAWAQQPIEVEIRQLDVNFVQPPVSDASGGRQRWVEMAAEYETRNEWLDELSFRFFVLVGAGNATRVLTEEITCVNIPRKANHVALMYLHPNTLLRYTNGELPRRVAVQVFARGRLIAQQSWPQATRERWWENFAPERGFVLQPLNTPFASSAFNRMNQIKQP